MHHRLRDEWKVCFWKVDSEHMLLSRVFLEESADPL